MAWVLWFGGRRRRVVSWLVAGLLLTLGVLAVVRANQVPYPPPDLKGVVVAIDPGHGGVDPGAASPGGQVKEKDLTLALALRLRAELEGAGAVPVLTRDGDHDPSRLPWRHPDRYRMNLRIRTATGAQAGAVVFISLHVDTTAAARGTRRGPSTYYGTKGAQAGAGEALASAIQAAFHTAFGVTPKAYPLNIYVLRENRVPAAMVEFGFLNNPEDLARLRDGAYQQALVRALVTGLGAYLRTSERSRAPATTRQPGPQGPKPALS